MLRRLVWDKIGNAWFDFIWWAYAILMKAISGPKWWRELKKNLLEENLYERGVVIFLIVSGVVVVVIELTALVALYRFTVFPGINWKWSLSFAASIVTWVALYLICDWRTKRRERQERNFMFKHTEIS